MKGRAKSLPVKLTKGLICSVREEPHSVLPCQFRFLTNHYQARAANPRKPRVRIWGVFGRVEKRFPGPEKFTRKEPRKVYGPEKFSGLLRNARQTRGQTSLLRVWMKLRKKNPCDFAKWHKKAKERSMKPYGGPHT